jgi:hypothetical protein
MKNQIKVPGIQDKMTKKEMDIMFSDLMKSESDMGDFRNISTPRRVSKTRKAKSRRAVI